MKSFDSSWRYELSKAWEGRVTATTDKQNSLKEWNFCENIELSSIELSFWIFSPTTNFSGQLNEGMSDERNQESVDRNKYHEARNYDDERYLANTYFLFFCLFVSFINAVGLHLYLVVKYAPCRSQDSDVQ